jgi:lysophospholipase L1-like esterase
MRGEPVNPTHVQETIRWTAAVFLSVAIVGERPAYAEPPPLMAMGDSMGEGVQSADASWTTQPFAFSMWVARQLRLPFSAPLIQSGPFSLVGDTQSRVRLDPSVRATNLAVSGADVHSLLYDRAQAATVEEISSETELVLFPRTGSQMELVEDLRPALVLCWIGGNDVLETAISWDQLDGTQMTPVDMFSDRFNEIADRLDALGGAVVFANIPDVTSIGFLMDREDLLRFLGSDFGLPDGSFTTLIAMLILRLGLDDGSLLSDPRFVLDPTEVARIQERTDAFNAIIDVAALRIGAPVVDVSAILRNLVENPTEILGIPLTHRFLGGMVSLDGVHPSNLGHAVVANAFVRTINDRFGTDFPQLTLGELLLVAFTDPFWDKDGDGRAAGRPWAGLLETLGPLLGISGDENDFVPDGPVAWIDPERGQEFLRRYRTLQGMSPAEETEWTRSEVVRAFKQIFAVPEGR